MNNRLKPIIPHIVAICSFLVASIIYFSPQLQNKELRQGDITEAKAMQKEIKDHYEETGEVTGWTNAMFGGMPTYQIWSPGEGNYVAKLRKFTQLFFGDPIGLYFVWMLSFYLLLLSFRVPWQFAIPASIAFALSAATLVMFEAGHLNKVRALSYLPAVLAGIVWTYRGKYFGGLALFGLSLALNLWSNHIQMTYYFLFGIMFFGVYELITRIKRGDVKAFLMQTIALVVVALIALGTTANTYLATNEYAKETMRGKPILSNTSVDADKNSSATEGLAWDYSMSWSQNFMDVVSLYIPSAAGGSNNELVGKSSPLRKDRAWKQILRNNDNRAPMYWGGMPFTSGPSYAGAIVIFLCLLTLIKSKNKAKWWIFGAAVFLTLLSMGKYCSIINRPLFDYFPLFNKFRAPNSIMGVTNIFYALLGSLSIYELINTDKKHLKEWLKPIYISAGVLSAISLLFVLFAGSFDVSVAGDARYVQAGFPVDILEDARRSLLRSSSIRSMLLVLVCGGLLWAFIKQKISSSQIMICIGLILLLDVWMVDKKYLNNDSFHKKAKLENKIPLRPVDQQILTDKDPHYRVHDLTINTYNSAKTSFYHKTIGGYHAAKLQRYQDVIDKYLSSNNQQVLDMLNTKYIIYPGQDKKPAVQRNPGALGNAWLVKNVRMVSTPDEEINALGNLAPGTEAVVNRSFDSDLRQKTFSGDGQVALTSYAPNKLTYSFNSSQQQLVVFSEVWYDPAKGWKVYIDDKETSLLRANYVLRAVEVPAGSHEIKMVFKSETNQLGITISRICSILLVLGSLGTFGYLLYNQFKEK